MRIDTGTAAYLHRMCLLLDKGTLAAEHITRECPECNGLFEPFLGVDDDYHVVYHNPENGTVAVLLGCEGYMVVDPKLAGLDAPNWAGLAYGQGVF